MPRFTRSRLKPPTKTSQEPLRVPSIFNDGDVPKSLARLGVSVASVGSVTLRLRQHFYMNARS
jgi:hypothetical protein